MPPGLCLESFPHDFKALIYCLQFVVPPKDLSLVALSETALENWAGPQTLWDEVGLFEGINWNQFLKLIHWHKVTPSVYKILKEYGSEHIPTKVLIALKSHTDKNTLRIMKLTSELLRIAKQFQKENLPFISFKGPLLAQRIYGDLNLREPRDLDLLIPEEHLVRAHELLLQQGYQLCFPKRFPPYLSLYTGYQKDFSYFHPEKRIILELHWRLFNNRHDFIFPMERIFDSPETEFLSGLSFAKMPAEIELLYLLHHGATHSWQRLCWLLDIKQYLARTNSPDWDQLLEKAIQLRAERSCFEGLALAQQLLNVPIEPRVARKIHQNKVVKAQIKTSCFIMTQSTDTTGLMRLQMLKSRFRLRAPSLSFYKAFVIRLLLRLFRIIPA